MRSIRRAQGADAASLQVLYQELHPYENIEVTSSRLESLAQSDDTHIFVSEESDEVLATATVFLCQDVLRGDTPFALVENMVVSSHYLREGIGKSLVDFIESFCLEKNCSRIVLLSDQDNRNARDFITAMGYDPDANIGFIKLRKYFGQ